VKQASNCFNEDCPGAKGKISREATPPGDLIKRGERPGLSNYKLHLVGVWAHVAIIRLEGPNILIVYMGDKKSQLKLTPLKKRRI